MNDLSGLSQLEAAERLHIYGPNNLGKAKHTSAFKILSNQFKSSVVMLLLAAAGISAWMQELAQSLGIIAALFINAAIGFAMEYRATVSMQKLVKLNQINCRVRRDGREYDVPATELVPDDVLLLDAGDMVPADCQILDAAGLAVDESILTGESVAAMKAATADDAQDSNVFQGTTVVAGRATCMVTATGLNTRLGSLSKTLEDLESGETPLERKLERLGRVLTVLSVVLAIAFVIVGIVRGLPVLTMIETSIALAIAVIPEGLPVVATLAMALGIQRMVANKALVRRLPAVETLGCTTVICTDKTGTLTENRMRVCNLATLDWRYEISGHGYKPEGEILNQSNAQTAVEALQVQELLRAAAICNNARLEDHGEGWHIHGDPTEGALLAAAAKVNISKADLQLAHARIAEIPFDLQRKRMSTLNLNPDSELRVFCKGSPESIISICDTAFGAQGLVTLTQERKESLLHENDRLASRGLRVIAVARRDLPIIPASIESDEIERNMTFLGLIGMKDPIKPGIHEALKECARAGIKVVMLTGDQANTALAIGKELGIATVFARVTPELKLSIVKSLQSEGHVVAMTGDGVNDALALKQSDIGIAMGKSASSLAREASALVVTDDNFGTIVTAISNGRQIYSKIKAAIAYLLTASVAALCVVIGAIILDLGILLNALQLLWLNLIVHIFPALGLVLQRNWEDMMTEPPRNPKGALLNVQLWQEIMFRALIVTAMTLVGSMVLTDGNPQTTSTIALSIIGFSLVFQSWTWFRASSRQSLQMLPMAINSLIAAGLLIAASSVPWLRTLLGTTLLSQTQFLQVLLFSLAGCVPFVCIKPLTDKAVTRNRARGKSQFILGDDRFTYQE